MTLNEKINADYIVAYKAKDAERVGVLRLLKTAVKNRLVELKRPQGELSDAEMLDVIIRQAKQRQDSVEQYLAVSRKDLADKEAAELEILKSYLPKTLSEEELDKVVTEAITKTGASSMREMGKVIGEVMGQYKGQVDGKILADLVKKKLQ